MPKPTRPPKKQVRPERPAKGLLAYMRRLPQQRWFRFAVLFATAWAIFISLMFSEIVKGENGLEMFASWAVLAAGIHAAVALVVAGVAYASRRPGRFSAKLVSVVVLALLLANYDTRLEQIAAIGRAIMPVLPSAESGGDLAIISLLFIALLVCLALGVGILAERLLKKYQQIEPGNLVLGILVLVGFVFATQALRAVPMLMAITQEYAVQAPALPVAKAMPKDKPDIYYIVLDRYTNSSVLKDQFGFDNSNFTSELKRQGFTVNDDAYANYPFTAMSIASTLTADYTNTLSRPFEGEELQSRTLYHKLVEQSYVVRALKQAGYSYHAIGSGYGTSNRAPLADVEHMQDMRLRIFGVTKVLRGLEQSTFKQSIFYRLANVDGPSWSPVRITSSDYGDEQAIKQLASLQAIARSDPGGRFIFAHVLVPHPPYTFNADGSISPYKNEDNVGKLISDKYLGQLEFINEQLTDLVQTIKERSDDRAVIALNADEGPYPTIINMGPFDGSAWSRYLAHMQRTGMDTWSDDWLRAKFGILQAAYIPEASEEDRKNLSSVNLFRIILTRYFGYDLPNLPECHLGLSDGNMYQYRQYDVTERLRGSTHEFCGSLAGGS